MAEKEPSTQNSNQKKQIIRQPPSIPFLWEEKPGIPRKHWKSPSNNLASSSLPPTKLVASVPFSWEEKPGKPLPTFSNQLFSLSLFAPISDNIFESADGGSGDHDVFDLETFSSVTEYSIPSAPSLLTDCTMPSLPIPNVLQTEKTSFGNNSNRLEAPYSPDSYASDFTSSRGTATLSHVKSSFLECLFPLFPPNSRFLGETRYREEGCFGPPEANAAVFGHDSTSRTLVGGTTLGELIRVSRMMSCRRKAIQIKKINHSTVSEFMKKRAFVCFNFGTISNMNMKAELQFQKKKFQIEA